jgi:hypothetical protein
MSDELAEIRALAPDPSAPSEEATIKARASLEEAIARERARSFLHERLERRFSRRRGQGRRTGSWPMRSLALALGLLAAGAAGVGVTRSGAPSAGPSSAVAALSKLAAAAAVQPAAVPGRGQYLFVGSHTQAVYKQDGCTILSSGREELWLGPDSSGFQHSVRDLPRLLSRRHAAACKDSLRRKAKAEGVGVSGTAFAAGCGGNAPAALQRLPTSSVALRAALERETIPQLGGRPAPAEAVASSLFQKIGALLGEGSASPALRAALYEVASRLPGVKLDGAVRDPSGRPGLGLEITNQGGATTIDNIRVRTELILDPASTALLAINSSSSPARFGAASSFWRVYTRTAIVNGLPRGIPTHLGPGCEHTNSYATGNSRRVSPHLWITTGLQARPTGRR